MFQPSPLGAKKKALKKTLGIKKINLQKTRQQKLMLAGAGVLSFLVSGLLIFYAVYIAGLPNIRSIEDNKLEESTVYFDRNGKELYRSYTNEKRQYIPYNQISENMVNAIVAAEDKTFFTNPGIDFFGLIRAVGKFAIGQSSSIRGTSTISQQLIKNWFLSNDRSLDRKIKEAYLSWKINQAYSKEKILELYLNKISFGSNAFGIEQASQTFFGKPAKDVGVLGASILASLPKGPSQYSPYAHRDRLMGYVYVTPTNEKNETSIPMETAKILQNPFFKKFHSFVSGLTFEPSGSKVRICGVDEHLFKKEISVDSNGCRVTTYDDLLSFWNTISIQYSNLDIATLSGASDAQKEEWQKVAFEYQTGRKDFVLGRMFEDGKIDGKTYLKAFIDGILFTFKPYQENIRAPHFIFYIRDLLQKKYGEDFFARGGMKIYTTIDLDLQKKAEEILTKKVKDNEARAGASNAALISLNNETGEILAMVGSADYFDEKKNGQVNIITSKRQPGSTFKPLVYALAMEKSQIGPQSPMYDLPSEFGDWKPKNFDGKFMELMTVKTALGNSRNIPAAKMFYLAGGEKSVLSFVQSAGLKSIDTSIDYGATLAIGTAEAKPMDMAEAYMTLANGGIHRDISGIVKVIDSDGNIIENWQKPAESRVISEAAAWLTWNILSDPSSRPEGWNSFLIPKNTTVAVKTGTSNKEVSDTTKGAVRVHGDEGDRRILPRDLWTIGYTPKITTAVWAGNADGSPTTVNGDGLQSAGPIFRDFMAFATSKNPSSDPVRPDSVSSVAISKINGKRAGDGTPTEAIVSAYFKNENVPSAIDTTGDRTVTVDSLCNGPVSETTPAGAIRVAKIIDLDSLVDKGQDQWMSAIHEWAQKPESRARLNISGPVVFSVSPEPCDRPTNRPQPLLSINIPDKSVFSRNNNHLAFDWTTSIADGNFVEVLLDTHLVDRISLTGSSGQFSTDSFRFPEWADGKYTLTLRLSNKWGDISEKTALVGVIAKDIVKPRIILVRPDPESDRNINIYQDQSTNIRANILEESGLRAVNVYVDDKLFKNYGDIREVIETINADHDFPIGAHEVRIEAIDTDFNKGSESFTITILQR